MQHLSAADKIALLKECHRILRPGGKVIFHYDIRTDNPLIDYYRRERPEMYRELFIDEDGHIGYEGIEENRSHFRAAGFKIEREIFHEKTPFLRNSSWQKLAHWPGMKGRFARLMRALTSGPWKIVVLALGALADMAVGRRLPDRYARQMTSVAWKA